MSAPATHPPRWQALYTGDGPPQGEGAPICRRCRAGARADAPALLYFDAVLTYADLDAQSDALAAALVAGGFARGDRLGLYLQNVPQFVVAMLAGWKAGGIVVPISPMSRASELHKLLPDCAPPPFWRGRIWRIIWCRRWPICRAMRRALPPPPPGGRAPHLPPPVPDAPGERLEALLAEFAGRAPADPALMPDAPAFLVYTSGTTGLPKGAIIACQCGGQRAHHPGLVWAAIRHGAGAGAGAAVSCDGLVGHIAVAWQLAAPLVLPIAHPETMLEAIARHRPCFTVGAITAYIAMMQSGASTPAHYASFHAVVSGGAPIPPAIVEEFFAHSGRRILNGYGLTETSAAVVAAAGARHAGGPGQRGAFGGGAQIWRGPVGGGRGRGAAGRGRGGRDRGVGPTVARGYWNRPADTAAAMRPDGFRTGDVGFMDAAGWVYLVDRKKDMINASGYKVWPREVEDVLYTHPAVREAGGGRARCLSRRKRARGDQPARRAGLTARR
jgi:long-chain acyl-CoA synthetase